MNDDRLAGGPEALERQTKLVRRRRGHAAFWQPHEQALDPIVGLGAAQRLFNPDHREVFAPEKRERALRRLVGETPAKIQRQHGSRRWRCRVGNRGGDGDHR